MPMYIDRTIILLIPAVLVALWAQAKVSSTYRRYKSVSTMNGYSGEQVARMMLDEAGLYDVPVVQISGELSDHYDPSRRIVSLSSDVFYGRTVASAGIAAHEVGHAIQHQQAYKPLVLRTSIAKGVGFASQMSMVLFFIGILLSFPQLTTIGIVFFSATVVFQLVTLPVEFNASHRALKVLDGRNILVGEEIKGAKNVLGAAAMTYVAAALMSITQLIRLIALSNRNND